MTSNSLEHKQETVLQRPRVRLVCSDRAMPFPEYRLLGLVGQGQFAQVYCAIHKQTGELVAIKQTRHHSEQLSQEPFVLNELCHPNIVCAQAMSLRGDGADAQAKADYQFVLDYCEAGTLRSQLDLAAQSVVLSPPSLIHIATDILKGLAYIHSHQVIHGDLKPENILLTYQLPATEAKTSRLMARISDFGSARFVDMPSRSRREIGSPTYAAPERFNGQSSYASDLYSAGVILYELLLGDRPFSGSPDYLRQAHQTQNVPFPQSLSSAVRQFLSQALNKQPEGRFGSAVEMLLSFQSLCESESSLCTSSTGRAKLELPAIESRRRWSFLVSTQSKLKMRAFSTSSLQHQADKIQQMLAIPAGHLIATDSAVYLLNLKEDLKPVIQLAQPSWIALSPKGNSLVLVPKAQQSQPMAGEFVSFQSFEKPDGDVVFHPLSFTEQSLNSADADITRVLSVGDRYILRVLTSPNAAKSYIECFTRKGKLIASFSLNLSLTYAAISSEPGQMAALSLPTATESAKLLLISLRPFYIHTVAYQSKDLHANPRGIGVFPWGFALIDEDGCLFLDRSARPVGRLNMKGITAIAPFSNCEALVAIASQNQPQTKGLQENTFPSEPSGLCAVDLNALNLDLVF